MSPPQSYKSLGCRYFASAFILVLYSLGLSSFLPPHIPNPFLFAFSSALL